MLLSQDLCVATEIIAWDGMLTWSLECFEGDTSIPVTGTGRTLCALIDNKALISRIQKWHYQGQAGTLAPEFDLL